MVDIVEVTYRRLFRSDDTNPNPRTNLRGVVGVCGVVVVIAHVALA